MYEYLDRRYALALYQAGEEKGKVDEYLSNLRSIVELIKNDEAFAEVIRHPQISTSKKKQTLTNIFEGKIDPELLSFLLLLVEKDRISSISEQLLQMEKIHLERNNTVIATVKTVVPLKEAEKISLAANLEKKYSKKIVLEEEIDASVLGGVYVRIGADVIDGTVKSKLEEMRKLMLANAKSNA